MLHHLPRFLVLAQIFLLLSGVAIGYGIDRWTKRTLLDLKVESQEAAVSRDYFYVGGRYVDVDGGSAYVGQMYVEKLSPALEGGCKSRGNLVLIHGQGRTGTNWLNKPDGSRGWASYFVLQGYTIYILDQTARGRSAWDRQGNLSIFTAESVQEIFTASENYNKWPQAKLHTQWPGAGLKGDPYFDDYYASTVPSLADPIVQQTALKAAGIALLDKIGEPVIMLAHSQGGIMPWPVADARPQLTEAIISIEPSGPPFENVPPFGTGPARTYGLTDIALTYEPPVASPEKDLVQQRTPAPSALEIPCVIQADDPPPRQLVNLKQIPVLVVTAESSYHAPYDYCVVKFLIQAGVNATHLELGKAGLRGNGHLMFLEKNSAEIAEALDKWMRSIHAALPL